MSLPSYHQSTDPLPNADPQTPSLPTSPSTHSLAVYALAIVTLLFSSFHQALALSNGTSSFLFFFLTAIIFGIVVLVGSWHSVNAHRRWQNGAITSIALYVCASLGALCFDGDTEVTISASVMHLGTLFLAAASVYSQRSTHDATSPPLMAHIGSAWQALVVLITDVVFLRSSLDRNAISFQIATASVTPAFLCHLSIIWLREVGYECQLFEFRIIATIAECYSFLLNIYALLLTVSSVFSAAYPMLKEIPIVMAFISLTMFCAVTYMLTVHQGETTRIPISNV